MQHEFSRTELLIGNGGLVKLRKSTVIVFGIGGVGSYTVEALARAAVGHLILVDYDDICLTNINRQLHALRSTVGEAKVEVMKRRILEINPEANVETIKEFYSDADADRMLGRKLDYVIDAIDTVSSKVSLAKQCLLRKVPLISSMGAGNRLTAENYRVTDISKTSGDPLAKAVRKLLRKEGITKGLKVVSTPDLPLAPLSSKADCRSELVQLKLNVETSVGESTPTEAEYGVPLPLVEVGVSRLDNCICPSGDAHCVEKRQIPGSISFVPSVVGLLMAGEVIRDLLNRESTQI